MQAIPFIMCLVAATYALAFGFVIGTVIEPLGKINNRNEYYKFNSELPTLIYVFRVIFSIFPLSVTRLFGRKPSMFLGGLIFLVGATVNGAAKNAAMLIIGHILLGVGVVFNNQSVTVYLSEMAPPKIRAAMNIGFQLFIIIGIVAAIVVNYFTNMIRGEWGLLVSLALAAVLFVIMIVGSIFLPDTPNSLIERGHLEEAMRMLQRIRGTDDINKELQGLIDASEASNQVMLDVGV